MNPVKRQTEERVTSRTTSSAWVRGIIELLGDAGFDASAICAAAGVGDALLEDPGGRVPTEQVSALWRAAIEVTGDPAVCMIGARIPKPGKFDLVGYAMLSSQNLRASLESFSSHMRLVSDAAQIELEDHGDQVYVRFHVFGGGEPMPRQRMEFDLLAILTFCRWVAGRPIVPIATMLTWPRPEYSDRLVQAVGGEILFEHDFNGYIFTRNDLDAPLPAANPSMAKVHDGMVQKQLAIFDGSSLALKVKDEIARRLSEGEPRREAVAAALHLGDRTLRRRLQMEGVSYEKLLDLTRCDLAQHYLANPKLSLTQITHLLGFTDQSAFFRSTRRWFGMSPGSFREQMRLNKGSKPE